MRFACNPDSCILNPYRNIAILKPASFYLWRRLRRTKSGEHRIICRIDKALKLRAPVPMKVFYEVSELALFPQFIIPALYLDPDII